MQLQIFVRWKLFLVSNSLCIWVLFVCLCTHTRHTPGTQHIIKLHFIVHFLNSIRLQGTMAVRPKNKKIKIQERKTTSNQPRPTLLTFQQPAANSQQQQRVSGKRPIKFLSDPIDRVLCWIETLILYSVSAIRENSTLPIHSIVHSIVHSFINLLFWQAKKLPTICSENWKIGQSGFEADTQPKANNTTMYVRSFPHQSTSPRHTHTQSRARANHKLLITMCPLCYATLAQEKKFVNYLFDIFSLSNLQITHRQWKRTRNERKKKLAKKRMKKKNANICICFSFIYVRAACKCWCQNRNVRWTPLSPDTKNRSQVAWTLNVRRAYEYISFTLVRALYHICRLCDRWIAGWIAPEPPPPPSSLPSPSPK